MPDSRDTSPGRGVALAILAVLAATALAPAAAAHDPAQALYHPVEVGDRWLVTGGEGTYAFLGDNGTATARGNLSGEGEVLRAPATTGTTAAALVRSFPDLVPHVQGFDDAGPAWRVEVGEPESHGFLLAREGGFTAFTTDGQQVEVGEDGRAEDRTTLETVPHARPAPAPEGDWWLPTEDALVRLSGGEAVDRVDYTGRPSDVTTLGDRVLVSLSHAGEERATLMVLDSSLELEWSRSLQGLRLGGSPAAAGESLVVATYNPDGANVVGLDPADGSVQWEQILPNATAAAPRAVQDRVVVATTEGLSAFAPNGTQLWSHASSPYLESPATLGDLIVPSGAENRLVALHPNGTLAWTWTDGVEVPTWTIHQDQPRAEAEATAREAEVLGLPLWPALAVLAGVAILVAVELRRRQG